VNFVRSWKIVACILVVCASSNSAIAVERSVLVLPEIALKPKVEAIRSVAVAIYCGHIDTISEIPFDWVISSGRTVWAGPNSDPPHEELSLIAAHELNAEPLFEHLRRAIKIRDAQLSCFEGSVTIEIFEHSPGIDKGVRKLTFPLTQSNLQSER